MTTNLSRRSLLALGAGLGAGLGASTLTRWQRAGARAETRHPDALLAPLRTRRRRNNCRFRRPAAARRSSGTFTGVPKEEVKKMLSDNFLNPDNVVLEQNSPVVNTGDKLILFDTGMGTSQAFGPTTGRQQKSLAEAGIEPGDIDAVVLSHAHIDHIGGIVGADDKPLFPNAQYYISQADFDYWTEKASSAAR